MEGKGSFFVLLIIIAFLSLTLTIFAVFLFFGNNSAKNAAEATQSSEAKRPSDEELAVMSLFEGEKIYNLKNNSAGNKTLSAIKVSVEIQYLKKIKGIKNVEEKIVAYEGEIKELVGSYFQNMTLEEASKTETKEKAKKDLAKQMNDLLMASEKEKKEIIYSVIFDEWFYQ